MKRKSTIRNNNNNRPKDIIGARTKFVATCSIMSDNRPSCSFPFSSINNWLDLHVKRCYLTCLLGWGPLCLNAHDCSKWNDGIYGTKSHLITSQVMGVVTHWTLFDSLTLTLFYFFFFYFTIFLLFTLFFVKYNKKTKTEGK